MPNTPDQIAINEFEGAKDIPKISMEGFMTGAFRYGSVSILAHMILNLPHPLTFARETQPKHPLRSVIRRPLEGFSDFISPASRMYRAVTPQFKILFQIAFMTLGGCVWAEKRVNEYAELVRRMKRMERRQDW